MFLTQKVRTCLSGDEFLCLNESYCSLITEELERFSQRKQTNLSHRQVLQDEERRGQSRKPEGVAERWWSSRDGWDQGT